MVGKDHFTSLYSPAKARAFTKRNIKAAWAATGLLPFNPDRILRHTPAPFAKSFVSKVVEVQSNVVGAAPATPVTTEGLASLYNLIKQDACTFDETSRQRLQRHVQKLASAAHISFAERALLQNQTLFLSRMNKEAKKRQSTKSVVLGKAKVMSYEDLNEARAKRVARDEANKGKERCGRKRKGLAPEPDTVDCRILETCDPCTAVHHTSKKICSM